MGVARSFQRGGGGGGHTLSNRVYSRFRNLNIVGCLSEKRLTKGGSRAPQDPPWLRFWSSLHPEIFQLIFASLQSGLLFLVLYFKAVVSKLRETMMNGI